MPHHGSVWYWFHDAEHRQQHPASCLLQGLIAGMGQSTRDQSNTEEPWLAAGCQIAAGMRISSPIKRRSPRGQGMLSSSPVSQKRSVGRHPDPPRESRHLGQGCARSGGVERHNGHRCSDPDRGFWRKIPDHLAAGHLPCSPQVMALGLLQQVAATSTWPKSLTPGLTAPGQDPRAGHPPGWRQEVNSRIVSSTPSGLDSSRFTTFWPFPSEHGSNGGGGVG